MAHKGQGAGKVVQAHQMHASALTVQVFNQGLALQQVAKPRQVNDYCAASSSLGAAMLCRIFRRDRGGHLSHTLCQRGVFAAVQHVQGKGFFLLEAVGHRSLNIAV